MAFHMVFKNKRKTNTPVVFPGAPAVARLPHPVAGQRQKAALKQSGAPAGNNRRAWMYYCAWIFCALLCMQALSGCGADASTTQSGAPASTPTLATTDQNTPDTQATSAAGDTPTPTSSASTGGSTATPTPESTPSSLVLHGPTNFVLKQPFHFSNVQGAMSDDSGALTYLDASTVKTSVTQEVQHLLFVVNSSNQIKVYSQGSSPVSAQLGYKSDGSATITYNQTADSEAGTVSIIFSGTLSKQGMDVRFEQQYNPSIMINAQASDVEAAFTSQVQWVAPNEIPAAPSNGVKEMTSKGGVALSWTAGQNAVTYDVYRQISDVDQQFKLLTTTPGTSYIDNSAETIQNLHSAKGVIYAIFAVGPTGVENPGGIVISV